jgi:hypothetical protein
MSILNNQLDSCQCWPCEQARRKACHPV